MLLYRFRCFQVLLVLLIQAIAIQRTQQLALGENYVNLSERNSQKSNQNENTTAEGSSPDDGLETPFIVLMSSDTISVAQLPMILYGNISDIYRLSQDEHDIVAAESEVGGQRSAAHSDDDDLDQRLLAQQDPQSLEEGGEDLRERKKTQQREHADAREYEQMPHQAATINTTTSGVGASLGKSEWQQIAASERDREEVWPPASPLPPPQQATQTNMNRKSSHEEEYASSEEERRQLGHPRRRRSSNSLSADDSSARSAGDGAQPEASGTRSDAQTSGRVNSAPESNARNVTSAQSGGPQLNLVLEETGAGVASSASSSSSGGAGDAASAEGGAAEGGDKTSSSGASQNRLGQTLPTSATDEKRVRFSDFDVHMALGYAFAADSAGRIHRFKLPLSGKRSANVRRPTLLTNNQPDWRIVSNSEIQSPSENDDANAINAGVRFEFASRQSKEGGASDHHHHQQQQQHGHLNSSSVDGAALYSGNSVHEDDYESAQRAGPSGDSNDVNRVNQRSRSNGGVVTHEQSGSNSRQHPTISGGQNVPASAHERADDSPISVGSRTLDQRQLADFPGYNPGSSEAKPRVIWSRNKHSLAAPLTAGGSPTHHKALLSAAFVAATEAASAAATRQEESLQEQKRQQLVNVEGALPVTTTASESNQMVDERTTSRAHRGQPQQQTLPPLAGRRHEGGGGPDENQSAQTVGGSEKQLTPMGGGRQTLRTEIAVDWLNNLLFVLDKCRLLVMDFDGNNELVLIDDFTVANRPVDIKVDPVNDFLFWLQVGKFHNTIYKLDLSVLSMPSATQKLVSNALRLRQSLSANENGSSFDASDLVPLVSHHYAHPIITNLPRNTQIFTIDHKHSKIYVPLVPPSVNTDQAAADGLPVDQSKRDEAEIFASTGDATHLNSTDVEPSSFETEQNCSQSSLLASEGSQILAYNLDGTDVGPFRTVGERGHISNLDSMQDLTLDSENNLLYWLTNGGKDLFEEFKENTTIQPAQHYLNGKSYFKLIYFDGKGFNQPTTTKSRFNVRKIIHILSSSIASNRPTRSDGVDEDSLAFSLKVRHFGGEPARISRHAPYIILGVTCLIVVAVYLVYALVFQQEPLVAHENDTQCREGSISGGSSSIGDSQVGSNLNGFINSSRISRWIGRPSVRSADASTFNRDVSSGNGPYDIESTNYEASNAIDEHYRDSIANASQLLDLTTNRLANLHQWPTNIHDVSNKLYVPIEVLQDDALASIRRVSIDQLEIDKTAPLGEGHFGTVLQGKVKCTLHERTHLLDKSQMNTTFNAPISPDSLAPPTVARAFGISSASSGHGSSSSTSCEFTTANSCTEPTNDEDYLTPKNQMNSTSSDYSAEVPHSSLQDDTCIEYCESRLTTGATSKASTKLMVAIKRLKDNASAEEKRDFLQEAKLLANFDHPNIVHLIGICLDRGSTLIVMELMLGGDLIRYMQENTPRSNSAGNLTYEDLLKVCLDIANGCCYLEDMDYIHRDLAARNCLVSSRKREDRIVKLADFGLARDIYKDSYYKKLNDSAMPLKWMAPECLIEQKFTKKSDVWSFGVVMWEVMSYCQEKPYVGVEPFFMKEHLASGGRLRQPDWCDDSMYRLMNQCWQMKPEDRPTFHECRAMLIEIRNKTTQL